MRTALESVDMQINGVVHGALRRDLLATPETRARRLPGIPVQWAGAH